MYVIYNQKLMLGHMLFKKKKKSRIWNQKKVLGPVLQTAIFEYSSILRQTFGGE